MPKKVNFNGEQVKIVPTFKAANATTYLSRSEHDYEYDFSVIEDFLSRIQQLQLRISFKTGATRRTNLFSFLMTLRPIYLKAEPGLI